MYVLVVCDYATRYPEAVALRTIVPNSQLQRSC